MELNLIDCPGHVDFSLRGYRALAVREGALLAVDAQAYRGTNKPLTCTWPWRTISSIIPVDQQDRPGAQPWNMGSRDHTGMQAMMLQSAKGGIGVPDPEAIVKRISPPQGDYSKPLQALIFDSRISNAYKQGCVHPMMEGELMPVKSTLLMGTEIKVDGAGRVSSTK